MLGDKAEWAKRLSQGGINGLYTVAIDGKGSMPPKGTCIGCSDAEIKAAVDYILKTTEESKGQMARKPTAPIPFKYSPALGQQVYRAQCAVCHDKGINGAPKIGDETAWAPIVKKQLDVLFAHTIYGYGKMPGKKPAQRNGQYQAGYCPDCSNSDIEQAVIYIANKSGKSVAYGLW